MSIPTAAAPRERAIGSCLLDARGRTLAQDQPHRRFYAASTIKLHVLVAGLVAVDAGRLALDATVPATRTFTGVDGEPFTLFGDHLDPTHPEPGTPVSVADLLLRMIDRSSNEATNHVLDLVGLPAVAEVVDRLGLTGTLMQRAIGDSAALAAGLTIETTASDLAATMRALAGPDHPRADVRLSARSRDLARRALRAQRHRFIGAGLDLAIDLGSKSGFVDGIRHDVAFLGDPDGPDVRYLAILTQGYGDDEAEAAIAAGAARLVPDLAR